LGFYNRFANLRLWIDSHPVIGIVSSILIFLTAFSIRYWLNNELPPGFPYLTFFPAIVIATFLLGTAAGILCAGLSFFSAWYFFLPPFMAFTLTGQTALALVFFIFIVAVDILVIDRMIKALKDLELSRAEAIDLAHQRDALFKELQHRVGNNLNMIAAMLSIQARSITDESARHQLAEAGRRIQLVADINRMFHDPAHSDGVMDEAFVGELVRKCVDAAGMKEKVSLSTQIHALAFRQDEFLPVALVLAESINNALEHGVADNDAGVLRVSLGVEEEEAFLRIENDGKPLAKGFDASTSRSIGLMLVNAFARQLGGRYTVKGGQMTRSELHFPLSRTVSPPQIAA
jgi:two-component system, sensor histidine kinase PdtaS